MGNELSTNSGLGQEDLRKFLEEIKKQVMGQIDGSQQQQQQSSELNPQRSGVAGDAANTTGAEAGATNGAATPLNTDNSLETSNEGPSPPKRSKPNNLQDGGDADDSDDVNKESGNGSTGTATESSSPSPVTITLQICVDPQFALTFLILMNQLVEAVGTIAKDSNDSK